MARNIVGPISTSSSSLRFAVSAIELTESATWWHDINQSPLWQDRIFHVLAVLYGIVSIVALVIFQKSLFNVVIVFFFRLIWVFFLLDDDLGFLDIFECVFRFN